MLGHDAAHAGEIGLNVAPDNTILARALLEERVIVTADLDFPRLFAMISVSGPGLILLRGGNFSEVESIECVRRVLTLIPAAELPMSVVVVDDKRIRRRWLPI